MAEDVEEIPGALWTIPLIDNSRVKEHPPLKRVVIAVDPEGTSGEDSADTGIIAVGLGVDNRGYVLGDFTIQGTPGIWGSTAVKAYYEFQADRLVAERNNGGDMVEFVIRTVDPNVPYKAVWASRGKITRAEPIAALYEQGRVSHVGNFPELEEQMCGWVPGMKSPDRMDALVWGFTELFLEEEEETTQTVSVDYHEQISEV
jgi:phage terminase large subunit-like protein